MKVLYRFYKGAIGVLQRFNKGYAAAIKVSIVVCNDVPLLVLVLVQLQGNLA